MSENLEVLERLYSEWGRGNMWALIDVADPAIEWEWPPVLENVSSGQRVYRGLAEVEATARDWLKTWDRYWLTGDEFIDAGDVVVVREGCHGRTAGSQSVIELELGAVWRMRAGRALGVRHYDSFEEACDAAGVKGSSARGR